MNFPSKGFYIHFKHDPAGVLNNYTYEVVGIGRNTEDNTFSVLYRPLHENDWLPPADLQSRPLEMFMEEVEREGKRFHRFARITDPAKIAELEEVKKRMYK